MSLGQKRWSASAVLRICGVSEETKEGGLRIGALTTITEIADQQESERPLPCPCQGSIRGGEPSAPQSRDHRRKPLSKTPMLVLPGRVSLPEKRAAPPVMLTRAKTSFTASLAAVASVISPTRLIRLPLSSLMRPPFASLDRKVRDFFLSRKFYVLPSQDVRKETVLKPNEILTEILLPPQPKGLLSSYRKVRARQSWDFALAGVALALKLKEDRVEKARVVLSGAAPIPWRSKEAEQALTGNPLNTETITRAVNAALKNAEPLEKNGYKVPFSGECSRRNYGPSRRANVLQGDRLTK